MTPLHESQREIFPMRPRGGVLACPDIEDLRKQTNGTSNGERMDGDVTAVAPARVRVPRLTTPPWFPIDRLPR